MSNIFRKSAFLLTVVISDEPTLTTRMCCRRASTATPYSVLAIPQLERVAVRINELHLRHGDLIGEIGDKHCGEVDSTSWRVIKDPIFHAYNGES
jgi:hypothetical protein